ncbi:hypothetical protein [Novosphingobium sp. FKTRR1]|uniref:hypothetical protein n=1 Tax=Novosphingobium sp. FKTRR1 TaxID=2879118 RepID=UPI001CEFDC95|nr:hypothetical protein [Novosphingobium sp. FKTRR1]
MKPLAHYRRWLLLPLALMIPKVAIAQQVIPPGTLMLAGYRATCGPVGAEVLEIDDLAASWGGRIYLSPRVFALPRSQQLFWYTHECAHQIFGPDEAVADCWSVEQGRIQGWLNRAEFAALEAKLRRLSGDAMHANGPMRVANVSRCFYR